jgi:hypothetical protein
MSHLLNATLLVLTWLGMEYSVVLAGKFLIAEGNMAKPIFPAMSCMSSQAGKSLINRELATEPRNYPHL